MEPSVIERFDKWAAEGAAHRGGVFRSEYMVRLEQLLPKECKCSAETGCGKSTVLFSNISKRHIVFSLDDRQDESSSVLFYEECPITKIDRVELVPGPTQLTLPNYEFTEKLDIVLIDGPHGYPFPELEYFYFYPWIKPGGILIIDDVNIASIGRLANFVAEDEMFEFVELVISTAVFKRTEAPVFDPLAGDGWLRQRYNRHRVSPDRLEYLAEGPGDKISSNAVDRIVYGEDEA